jgi:hypothetical protein
MPTNITDSYFEFGIFKYYRGNAHLVDIASYGEKKGGSAIPGSPPYLSVHSKVARGHLEEANRVQLTHKAEINWNQTTKAQVEVNGRLKYFVLGGKMENNVTYEEVKNANLKLINFAIHEGPLMAMLNTDADGARNFLANEGNDARIVSEVWVVVQAELADHFEAYGSITRGGKVSVEAIEATLELTATGGRHGSQTIILSPGTAFAYKLHKVTNWSNNKTHIDKMEDDYYGMR